MVMGSNLGRPKFNVWHECEVVETLASRGAANVINQLNLE